MAYLSRVTDFTPSTLIQSSQVDAEFDQLVNLVNGTASSTQVKLVHNALSIGLEVDNTGGGVIQAWYDNSVLVSQITAIGQFESKLTTGNAPLVVASTTLVSNLNADLLDGSEGSAYAKYADDPAAFAGEVTVAGAFSVGGSTVLEDLELTPGGGTSTNLRFSDTGETIDLNWDMSTGDFAMFWTYGGPVDEFFRYDTDLELFYFWGSGNDPSVVIEGGTSATLEINDSNSNAKALILSDSGITTWQQYSGGGYVPLMEFDGGNSQVTIPASIDLQIIGALELDGNNGGKMFALSDGATINWDMDSSGQAKVTLGGNRAFANPTNILEGGRYVLIVDMNGYTPTFGTYFKFSGGVKTGFTGLTKFDIFAYTTTQLLVTSTTNMS